MEYSTIYTSQIFQLSQCIWHENTVLDFLRSCLKSLGYISQDNSNKVWQRGHRTVVTCLVDDFTTCSTDYSRPLPYLFDQHTVVITDNRVNAPTQYRVCQLPTSFYGIYSHSPDRAWDPQRRLNLAINRLDSKRLLLFLEHQLRNQYNSQDQDLVNFNCWAWDGDNASPEGLRSNFDRYYGLLDEHYHSVYASIYDRLRDQQPYRNHDLDLDGSHRAAWMNLVMETYSSDLVVALSEKAFRALVLPVPWMLYSGRHSTAYLASLGFDVLGDLIEHRYDGMIENKTAAYGDKMVDFLFEAVDTVQRLQSMPRQDLDHRLAQASQTNQALLASMRQQWPGDFASWLDQTIEMVS